MYRGGGPPKTVLTILLLLLVFTCTSIRIVEDLMYSYLYIINLQGFGGYDGILVGHRGLRRVYGYVPSVQIYTQFDW